MRRHRLHQDQRGQILPALVLMVMAMLGAGLLLFQVGHATALQAGAQTAADAAALAGARSVRDQLFLTDRRDPGLVDDSRVRAATADYAARNGATAVEYRREGLDVIVTVQTDDALGAGTDQVDAEGRQGRATARARVTGGQPPVPADGGSRQTIPAAPPGPGGVVEAARREADRIDRLQLPYIFGSGHGTPAPPNGPFDCSSAVSRVLQAAGYDIPTLVSGQFEDYFPPGPGRITIYAYDGHVFMVIDGRGFGTSTLNPGGGAGWLPYNTPYHSLFKTLHAPVENDVVPEDLGEHVVPAMTSGTPYDVILVPLGG